MNTHLDLFSGIGGFTLAAERAGWRTIGFSEVDPAACIVLKTHWPHVKQYGDIRNVTAEAVGPVGLITGGFPCQPYSLAGKRRGAEDDRALWPEMLRAIAEIKPSWVLAENVPGIINLELERVLADMEAEGYEVGTLVIPACAVDAVHRRDRVWIVAHREQSTVRAQGHGGVLGSSGEVQGEPQERQRVWSDTGECGSDVADASHDRHARRARMRSDRERPVPSEQAPGSGASCGASQPGRCGEDVSDTLRCGWQGRGERGSVRQGEQRGQAEAHGVDPGRALLQGRRAEEPAWWEPEPTVGRVANGIPHRAHRLRLLGNAIVPQVAEPILRWMREIG